MKYSQIISYYKQPHILQKTLYTWANQTFPKEDYEILVMDGGNDGLSIVKYYKQHYPEFNLRYFTYDGRIKYKCPVHAWNVGVKQAKGVIIGITMEDRLTTFDAVEALYMPHTRENKIFCTVLPRLMEGTLEDDPLDNINIKWNPKLLWSVSKPTTIATKENRENETVMFSLLRDTMVSIGGFDESWRDYGYWMLSLYQRMINSGLTPHEVSWIPNVHHHHARHGTMEAEKYDRQARIAAWEKIKKLNNHDYKANVNQSWGELDGDVEVIL